MNPWLRRYLAVGGTIVVLSNVAKTHPSQTEMAWWILGMAVVGFIVYRWLGEPSEPSRPKPSPRLPYSPPMSEYLPPSKVKRPWSGPNA
jgi:hypothetical protein